MNCARIWAVLCCGYRTKSENCNIPIAVVGIHVCGHIETWFCFCKFSLMFWPKGRPDNLDYKGGTFSQLSGSLNPEPRLQ